MGILYDCDTKLKTKYRQFNCKGLFKLTLRCVAVQKYQLLSATSHRSITVFQVKMNLIFMRYRSAVTWQFLRSRVQCGNATQLRRSMNGP